MCNSLPVVVIAAPVRGSYVRHVITCGHVPGVLSGAELQGRARSYGARYERSRARACEIVAPYGVRLGVARSDSGRWFVAWVGADGRPVRVRLETP
jgi:hypothetical protein